MGNRPTPSWIELDNRKAAILRAIVKDYVETVEPVGSETLVQKYPLGVKSATVRNEMALMSEWGYLYQPHPSAGRVPSDLGYRYYVERLFVPVPPPNLSCFVQRLPQQVGSLGEIVMASLRLLAEWTRYATVATLAGDRRLRLVRCVLTPFGRERVLLVCAFDNGYIESRLIELSAPCSARELKRIQVALSQAVEGQRGEQILRLKPGSLPPFPKMDQREMLERFLKVVQSATREATRGEFYYEGLVYMLEQPEFQRHLDLLEAVLRTLEKKEPVYDILESNETEEFTLLIGHENPIAAFQSCTLVFAPYYTGKRAAGVIGVLGPTRMNYDRTLPMVKQIAKGLSQILTREIPL